MFTQGMMTVAGLAYVGCAIGWLWDGKPWLAATFALYAATIVTLFMAGRSP